MDSVRGAFKDIQTKVRGSSKAVKRLTAVVIVVAIVVLLTLDGGRLWTTDRRTKFYELKHQFSCSQILRSSNSTLAEEATHKKRTVLSDYECYEIFADCELVRSRHFYPTKPDSDQEREFPLAYVILVSEHLEQVEMLLNAIYAPQNFYCFHVDLKVPFFTFQAIERLAKCFPNVIVAPKSFAITRETAFAVDAFSSCIEGLYSFEARSFRRQWKYLITLENHDFPLKTNLEIVQILSMYQGFNDIELRSAERYSTEEFEHFRRHGAAKGERAMANVTLYKGSVVAAVSRPFVDHALKHPMFNLFKAYLRIARYGAELFWGTLNHNDHLGLPGTYPGRCAATGRQNIWISRFAIWQQKEGDSQDLTCHSQWHDFRCVQSCVGLASLINRPELFVDQVREDVDVIAIDCLHQLLYHRRYHGSTLGAPNMSYYEQVSAVQYSKWLEAKRRREDFKCVTCSMCSH